MIANWLTDTCNIYVQLYTVLSEYMSTPLHTHYFVYSLNM